MWCCLFTKKKLNSDTTLNSLKPKRSRHHRLWKQDSNDTPLESPLSGNKRQIRLVGMETDWGRLDVESKMRSLTLFPLTLKKTWGSTLTCHGFSCSCERHYWIIVLYILGRFFFFTLSLFSLNFNHFLFSLLNKTIVWRTISNKT